ncbi:hypothetical protein B0H15DRAFT_896559 [Mycena belliarum]|uniref:Uncharacterized protein n=1 Tax=Mycena belliarum TaxID=1033014 RepID=A0AAD6UIQ6_9AGAR|nr:hypothetical protein B0H15DRAFT_896559 [Mycena belliae]
MFSPQMATENSQLIADLGDEDLQDLGFLGPEVHEDVKSAVLAARKASGHFQWLTVSHVQSLSTYATFHTSPPLSPTSDTTAVSSFSDATVVDPDFASPFEKAFFYKGISEDHPPLLHRSDILKRPFVLPAPEDQHTAIPDRTAHGATHPVLTPDLWRQDVGPAIVSLLGGKESNVHVSSMFPVQFSSPDGEGNPVLEEHLVVWISVFPGTTSEESCRNANGPILAILEKRNVKDAAVHWIEGAPERFGPGPAMMSVVDDTDPTAYIRRAVTAVLGVPLAPQTRHDNDGQGSLGVFFHEGRDKDGKKSDRVFAFTNKHVVSECTKSDYELGRSGARKQYIRNCGLRRYEKMLEETRAAIAKKVVERKLMAEQLEANVFATDTARGLKRAELTNLKREVVMLDDFLGLAKSSRAESNNRVVGWLDYAPRIQNDVDTHRYTWDGAVFELDKARWEQQFQGNCVHLGGKFAPDNITRFFHPNTTTSPSFKYPLDHLLRLQGFVEAKDMKKPYLFDELGNRSFIVAKEGQTTDLTFGRFSEFEAYVVSDLAGFSWEVAVLNYAKENFSYKGDSGSCIFNAEGKMVAFLHSGMPRGMSSHVTFGTPAHFVRDQIKKRYPHADFSRTAFSDVAA